MTPRIHDCVSALLIDSVAKAVLLVLIRYADFTTGEGSRPSIETIQFYVGSKSKRTVQAALRRLADTPHHKAGLIEQQDKATRYRSTTYRIRFDRIRFEAARADAARQRALTKKQRPESTGERFQRRHDPVN